MNGIPCYHAKYCQRRMRDGDQPGGCNYVDQRTCTPLIHKISIIIWLDRRKVVDQNQKIVV